MACLRVKETSGNGITLSCYQAELSEIRAILALRALSNLEYRAAERTLQVSIAACIGVAKHWQAIPHRMPIRHSSSWPSVVSYPRHLDRLAQDHWPSQCAGARLSEY